MTKWRLLAAFVVLAACGVDTPPSKYNTGFVVDMYQEQMKGAMQSRYSLTINHNGEVGWVQVRGEQYSTCHKGWWFDGDACYNLGGME